MKLRRLVAPLALIPLAACGTALFGRPLAPAAMKADEACGLDDGGMPRKTPDLVNIGNAHRDSGLKIAASSAKAAQQEFIIAGDCYSRALALAPDNYDANLGLGVTYIGGAKAESNDEESPLRRSLLSAAKRRLGQAYMLRQGPYEPLYYLAEVAALEGNKAKMTEFLKPLTAANVKSAPVYALLGHLAYEAGDRVTANKSWQTALAAGSPFETIQYLTTKRRRSAGMMAAGILAAALSPAAIIPGVALAATGNLGIGAPPLVIGNILLVTGVVLAIVGGTSVGPDIRFAPLR